jgi:hypothetical protein
MRTLFPSWRKTLCAGRVNRLAESLKVIMTHAVSFRPQTAIPGSVSLRPKKKLEVRGCYSGTVMEREKMQVQSSVGKKLRPASCGRVKECC